MARIVKYLRKYMLSQDVNVGTDRSARSEDGYRRPAWCAVDSDAALVTLPGIGPIASTGFEHPSMFLLGLVPVVLLVLYVVAQIRRRRRVTRFTGAGPLDSGAPRGAFRWSQLPLALMLCALLLLTVALAGPTQDIRVPRNRAVIMLVVDVSQSMRATDVLPSRLAVAQQAAKRFAASLAPGVNLGLISFAGNVNVLVAPNPDHRETLDALDNLRPADKTSTGEAIFSALQSIQTVAAVLSSDSGTAPPPARIVLLSDGAENVPSNPNDIRGAYAGARYAKDQGIPISTISFGTPGGYVVADDQRIPVPVETDMMNQIAQLSGGQYYAATNVDELGRSYESVQRQIGYLKVPGPGTAGWLRLAMLTVTVAAALALLINRRLPT
jgi:Ca-activated chloride channel family protein